MSCHHYRQITKLGPLPCAYYGCDEGGDGVHLVQADIARSEYSEHIFIRHSFSDGYRSDQHGSRTWRVAQIWWPKALGEPPREIGVDALKWVYGRAA